MKTYFTLSLVAFSLFSFRSEAQLQDCKGQAEALVIANVQKSEFSLENGHDPLCVLTLELTKFTPSAICPLLQEDVSPIIQTETLFRITETKCLELSISPKNKILGVLSKPVLGNERAMIEIFD